MIWFSQRVLPLMILGAAAVLSGCIGEAPLEGDDEQEAQPDTAETIGTEQQALDSVSESTWACVGQYVNTGNYFIAGEVTIWWGHRAEDAIWACDEWVPRCGGWCVSANLIRWVR